MAMNAPELTFSSPVTIRLVIDDFSTNNTMHGSYLTSDEVQLDAFGVQSSWQLKVHPRGSESATADDVSVYLVLTKCSRFPIVAQGELCIVGADNAEWEDDDAFGMSMGAIGCWGLVTREELLGDPARYLPDGKLTVAAQVCIAVEYGATKSDAKSARFRLGSGSCAWQFFDSDRFSDCTIRCVDGSKPDRPVLTEIGAHRNILSVHSSVLAAKFDAGLTDIEVDVDQYSMNQIMRLLYSGSLRKKNLVENGVSLFLAAAELGVDDLTTLLDKLIAGRPMKIEDAARLFPVADKQTDRASRAPGEEPPPKRQAPPVSLLRNACSKFFKKESDALLAVENVDLSLLTKPAFLEAAAKDVTFLDGTIRIVDSVDKAQRTVIKTCRVHRLILAARSNVFKVEFLTEPKKKQVDVEDIAPVDMESFRKALYGQQLNGAELDGPTGNEKMAAEKLLELASFYSIDDIIDVCARHLVKRVALGNVFRLLSLADRYRAPTIKSACIDLIRNNRGAAMAHPTFAECDLSNPLLKELLHAIAQ